MLTRVAGRKLCRDAPGLSATHRGQWTLPWLCPALSRRSSHIRPIQTTPPPTQAHETSRQHPRRPSLSSPSSSSYSARTLATTTDLYPTSTYNPYQQWARPAQAHGLSRLVSWNPSDPLVVRDSLAMPPTIRQPLGIGSDPVELHQNLYACLRVGRLDRGAVILKRLMSLYNPAAPEATDAHNTYLQALLELGQQDSRQEPSALKDLELWYANEMISAGVQPNAQTFVILLRAAMSFLEENARDEAVRDFIAQAHALGPEIVDDVNGSPDFTDEEWDTLIRLQPETYEEPPSVPEVQTLHTDTSLGRENLINHGLVPRPSQSIKPVPQKGTGLDSLKQALAMFDNLEGVQYPHDMEGSQKEKDQAYAYARQVQMERDSLTAAVQRWKHENDALEKLGIHGVLNTKSLQALMFNWYTALVPLFKKQIDHSKKILSASMKDNVRDDAQSYGAWLERCTAEDLAAITVSRSAQSCVQDKRDDYNGLKISSLSITIGSDIEDHLQTEADDRRNRYLRKQRKLTRSNLMNQLSKKEPKPSTASNSTESTMIGVEKVHIPLSVRTKLGAMCLELLLQAATMTMTVDDARTGKKVSHTMAAFSHQTGHFQGKKVGILVPHHELMKKLRTESVHSIATLKLPMVVEPKPWLGFEDGAYYTTPSKVVRQKDNDSAQRAYAQSAIENGDMDQVLKGLDVLGKVPWQINAPVFEVMVQIWNSGETVGALIGECNDLKRPPEPTPDATFAERAKWSKELKEYENEKSGLHSQRCFVNLQLETARSFLNEEKIFFPHSVDFRGRAYPIPPILNHIGSDLARGLLKFARGKELGTVGLQWLKIHLANLYGFDKASLKEREQFATDNLSNIYDSAENPLHGQRWWAKAEDPWQCLACCMELRRALDSPDPTRFISQLPIHQDGTCNGLQHYAALGGDDAGARQVNLEPSDRPQDIYTGVAELVKEMVAKDAAEGKAIAKFIQGHITRKVVKRTVMTNVYGVTFMGAKQQVYDELRSIFPNFKGTEEVEYLPSVALYVASKIFQALGKIFNGAQEIQYWLGECGERITTSISAEQVKKIGDRSLCEEMALLDETYQQPKRMSQAAKTKMLKSLETLRTSIIWTTPLKMPIVQPYRKVGTQTIKTKIQDISIAKRSSANAVDKRKQLQAFPPNFIHSLDATHMILSALKCSEVGLDFAAVHDSFWTHASDIPTLNTILRDAFVRMHSEDIIGRLHAEFTARYSGALYRASIISSSKVAQKIVEWRKVHRSTAGKISGTSQTRLQLATWDEVALEAQRRNLLASEDPVIRRKGEDMVTPTSIWLAHQDPKALHSHRLDLLGQTKGRKAATRQEEVRKKVLSAEAEVISCENMPIYETKSAREVIAEDDIDEMESTVNDDNEIQSSGPTTKTTMEVWIPLSFPPVPEKGGWDVSRLRESKYFFS